MKSALVLGVGAFGAQQQAEAQIVVTDLNDQLLEGNSQLFTFDPGTGVITPDNSGVIGTGYFYARTEAPSKGAARFSTYNTTWYQPTTNFLDEGDVIDGASTYVTQNSFGSNYGAAVTYSDAYVGLRFDQTGGDATDAYYGWLRFSYGDSVGLTLHAFGMETSPNTAILAGATSAVPEPATTAALLGLAATAVVIVRRRKKRAA